MQATGGRRGSGWGWGGPDALQLVRPGHVASDGGRVRPWQRRLAMRGRRWRPGSESDSATMGGLGDGPTFLICVMLACTLRVQEPNGHARTASGLLAALASGLLAQRARMGDMIKHSGPQRGADGDDSLTRRESAQFKQRCAHASGCVQPHHARRGCGFRDLRRRIHQSTKSCSYESRNARSPKLRTGGLTDNARRSTTAKAYAIKNGLQCLCCRAFCLRLLNLWSEALSAICSAAFGTKLQY